MATYKHTTRRDVLKAAPAVVAAVGLPSAFIKPALRASGEAA